MKMKLLQFRHLARAAIACLGLLACTPLGSSLLAFADEVAGEVASGEASDEVAAGKAPAIDFEARVPIEIQTDVSELLQDNCLKCHGEKKRSGKLDLRTVETIIAGGRRGSAIDADAPKESRLLQLVRAGAKPHMPPGKKQLTDQQISVLTQWVQLVSDSIIAARPAREHAEDESGDLEPAEQGDATDRTQLIPDGISPTLAIDVLVEHGWHQSGTVSSDLCSDPQFVRRLYLDVVGRIPTVAEHTDFVANTNSNKRLQLVEELLASPEYASHFAELFDSILMGRNEGKLGDRRSKGWAAYLENVFAQNRSWDKVAREVLLARADSPEDRGHLWYLYERNNKHQEIAESISKGFFGVDIACAQCHDHPLVDEILQSHYWGLVSFYNRSKNENTDHGFAVGESAIGGFNSYANALEGTTDDAILTFLQREPVPEVRPDEPDKQEDKGELYIAVDKEPRIPRFSRRERFVESIVTGHPLLARNLVNRVWALMMGRGIVHPVEEMDSRHAPSHPELLDWLARDFEQHDYDVRRLVRAIVLSRSYQLDSRRPDGDPAPATFAYALEKPLTAEVMVRSFETALEVGSERTAESGLASEFRRVFPDVIDESGLSNLKQTLTLSNFPGIQQLTDSAAAKMDAGAETIVQDLFMRCYGRKPQTDEFQMVSDYLQSRADRPTAAISQVLWALLTSAEFRFNH